MKIFTTFLATLICLIFTSCSSRDIYISPKYKDKTYTNIGIDILYPRPQENWGTDSLSHALYQQFHQAFRKYFQDGVKMFSTISKVSNIYYDQGNNSPQLYNVQSTAGKRETLMLPDSIQNLQNNSSSDFFMIIQTLSWSVDYKSSRKSDGYVTRFHLNYSLWDDINGNLVSYGNVNSEQEFKVLTTGWPYKSSIIKLAAETFKNLPMFAKN